MNLVQRLMGRRQFLIAAGMASGCALTCKKLAGLETGAAMAAGQAVAAGVKAAGNRCPHLLSPLRIRNAVLKNRIMHTVSPPYLLQGPEDYPTDAYRNHYSNMAKNAAIVTISMHFGTYPKTYQTGLLSGGRNHFSDSSWLDIPPVHNYIERMINDIHVEGALVRYPGGGGAMMGGGGGGAAPGGAMPQGQATGDGTAQGGTMPQGQGMGQGAGPGGAMPEGQGAAPDGAGGGQGQMPGGEGGGQGGMPGGEGGAQGGMPGGGQGGMPMMGGGGPMGQSSVSIEDIVAEAKEVEDAGYDVYEMGTSSLEAVKAVRAATNLILMSKLRLGGQGMERSISDFSIFRWNYTGIDLDWQFGDNSPGITNNNQPTADELEEAVEQARKLEGLADFVWIRDGRHEHPNSWTQDKESPFNLAYAEAIKKAGIDILTCPSAGFHDPVQNDGFIADGKCDMIGMTTPFFADPDLIKKVLAGRADDVIPCIQCHNCHGISRTHGPWYQTCAVNPRWATPAYKLEGIHAPLEIKKVAIIGGGPAGMQAAIIAAERGHKVTLYEKSDSLGGLLQFTDYTQWKWNYKDIKDWLAYQVKKKGVEVQLKTTATPDMIRAKGFDTVLVAVGAEPVISKMAGADAGNVFNILTAYSKKKNLGKNVVVIGAGRIGTECAIGIAKDGHKVTQITSGKDLIELEAIGSHNMMNQISILQNHPDYDCILEATVKDITGGKVTYTDSEGKEKSIKADSIVMYSGLKARTEEAADFSGSAPEVLLMGDCTGKNGTVQKAIRSAYFMASQV